MAALNDKGKSYDRIMIVDDSPDSLALLGHMLREKNYEVVSFLSGGPALEAAARVVPDLILLDVGMPGMDGYEVCKRLKSIPAVAPTPVLFVSGMDEIDDKVRGFQSGAVDYIAKPFQFEEVRARVEIHLKLRRAQQTEKELLERTLNGSMRMLSTLMNTAAPELATRSRGIRECVKFLAKRTGVSLPWQYDLAATLSLIGCITLPEEVFQKAYADQHASDDEIAMFRRHPDTAANLLAQIPRLEPVAAMIRLQQNPAAGADTPADVELGARMLHLATELDRRMYRGLTFRLALADLKRMAGQFDAGLFEVLNHYSPALPEFHYQVLPIKQLSAGMTLEEDVVSKAYGTTIFREGTVLNEVWIERLEQFAKHQGVNEPLRVRVPAPGRFKSLWFEC